MLNTGLQSSINWSNQSQSININIERKLHLWTHQFSKDPDFKTRENSTTTFFLKTCEQVNNSENKTREAHDSELAMKSMSCDTM